MNAVSNVLFCIYICKWKIVAINIRAGCFGSWLWTLLKNTMKSPRRKWMNTSRTNAAERVGRSIVQMSDLFTLYYRLYCAITVQRKKHWSTSLASCWSANCVVFFVGNSNTHHLRQMGSDIHLKSNQRFHVRMKCVCFVTSFSRVFMCKLSCTHLKSALSTDTTWVMNTWEDLDRETFTSKNTFAQYLK